MSIVIHLPYDKPPLSMNSRDHWRKKASVTAELRWLVASKVRALQLTPVRHVTLELHYVPRDARRRDEDNLVATMKPCCDAIVDAGLVKDDAPQWMTKRMPIIDPPDPANPHLYLVITTGKATN